MAEETGREVMETSVKGTMGSLPPDPGREFKITLEDLGTGETWTTLVPPGAYAIFCREPIYQDGEVRYPNGTTVITLKVRQPT